MNLTSKQKYIKLPMWIKLLSSIESFSPIQSKNNNSVSSQFSSKPIPDTPTTSGSESPYTEDDFLTDAMEKMSQRCGSGSPSWIQSVYVYTRTLQPTLRSDWASNRKKNWQNRCCLILTKSPPVPDQASYISRIQNLLFHSFSVHHHHRFFPIFSLQNICCSVTQVPLQASLVS